METRPFLRDSSRQRMIALVAIALVAFALAYVAGTRWSRASVEAESNRAASSRALTNVGLLTSELQKYRLLPLVLADYPDVHVALAERTPASIDALNKRLELLAARTDAAALYVIDEAGLTIASSNWRLDTSFVGQNYAFRPYFYEAQRHGSAEQFALGTISRRPGLFLAQRVNGGYGVVVVKVEFDRLEQGWVHQSGPTIVRDANGVIIMTSRPQYRMLATRPLTANILKQVSQTLQYGSTPPRALKWDLPAGSGVARDTSRVGYALVTLPVPVRGWTLTAMEPLAPAQAAANATIGLAALGAMLVIVVGVGLVLRDRERRRLMRNAQRQLESEVQARTQELRLANESLVVESAERARNEARLRVASEELAQSNRLVTLGQISAGVAHEINQPVAAIQTFAENATVMLGRENADGVRGNLARIVELTQRIGTITAELRLFARREHHAGPVPLSAAIDGTLLLIGDRLREAGVSVSLPDNIAGVSVLADKVRLEQILINLVQNAADAMAETPAPRLDIRVRSERRHVTITISDNGPGIPAVINDRLFSPFATTKTAGLGLGLVIARDLAREFGGDLVIVPGALGACFTIRLKRA